LKEWFRQFQFPSIAARCRRVRNNYQQSQLIVAGIVT
jgi:hypothetical protein